MSSGVNSGTNGVERMDSAFTTLVKPYSFAVHFVINCETRRLQFEVTSSSKCS